MNDLQAVGVALGLLALMNIYSCIKGWRKKRLLHELKHVVNSIGLSMAWLLSFYALIGVASLVPTVTEWAKNFQLSSDVSPLVVWLIRDGTACAWVLMSILIITWMWRGLYQPLKYNDKEKEWHKEESLKIRAKLPHFLQSLVRVK